MPQRRAPRPRLSELGTTPGMRLGPTRRRPGRTRRDRRKPHRRRRTPPVPRRRLSVRPVGRHHRRCQALPEGGTVKPDRKSLIAPTQRNASFPAYVANSMAKLLELSATQTRQLNEALVEPALSVEERLPPAPSLWQDNMLSLN